MSKLHFLNVKQGDCNIIEHSSGRLSMIDICNGNAEQAQLEEATKAECTFSSGVLGNFQMCSKPTHPIDYIKSLNKNQLWRFILSHPDMDHMDGLDKLCDEFQPLHFWDSGMRREKPDFGNGGYNEGDWDRYEELIAGSTSGTKTLGVQEDASFSFANEPADEHDGLYILSPNQTHLDGLENDINDGSYVILYRSPQGKILLPGDAHDKTWEHLLEHHSKDIENCKILLAPHHGRESSANFDFLKTVNPDLVLIGCAKSKDLAYDKYRDYTTITNNQAGNVVAETVSGGMEIYVQNMKFAEAKGGALNKTNSQGYFYIGTI